MLEQEIYDDVIRRDTVICDYFVLKKNLSIFFVNVYSELIRIIMYCHIVVL